MKILLMKWVTLTVAIILTAAICNAINLPFTAPIKGVGDVLQIFVGAAVLAFLGATLGKILKLITLPLNCLTLGLMSLVINGVILWWVGSLGFGFKVDNYLSAFVGSILISICNAVVGSFLIPDKDSKRKGKDDE